MAFIFMPKKVDDHEKFYCLSLLSRFPGPRVRKFMCFYLFFNNLCDTETPQNRWHSAGKHHAKKNVKPQRVGDRNIKCSCFTQHIKRGKELWPKSKVSEKILRNEFGRCGQAWGRERWKLMKQSTNEDGKFPPAPAHLDIIKSSI